MRAAQLVAPGRFEMREVATPRPARGEVLVRVLAAGICSSDAHIVQQKEPVYSLPMTLGHETAGVIEKLGEGVRGLEVGQRVLVAGIWGCGRCRPCGEGCENACEYWARRAPIPHGPGLGFHGGMAGWMVAPARSLFLIGDLDPVTTAPLADAGVAPCHAIHLAREHLRPDRTVVVIGATGFGDLAIQILRATTGCRIIAVDDAGRLTEARGLGADETVVADLHASQKILALTGGLGAQVVLDFVGSSPTLDLANAAVAIYGAVVAVGLGLGSFRLVADAPPAGRPKWGVTLIRPYGYTNRDMYEVIHLAQRGLLKATVEQYSLEEAPTVLEAISQGRVQGRAVLIPDPAS